MYATPEPSVVNRIEALEPEFFGALARAAFYEDDQYDNNVSLRMATYDGMPHELSAQEVKTLAETVSQLAQGAGEQDPEAVEAKMLSWLYRVSDLREDVVTKRSVRREWFANPTFKRALFFVIDGTSTWKPW